MFCLNNDLFNALAASIFYLRVRRAIADWVGLDNFLLAGLFSILANCLAFIAPLCAQGAV
jgi:hypothetical protein